ncbi:unnamed protein product [Rotaria sordida]|uniref:DDE Tnp4 domain-containing protein n=3 Tax=Rotaria sordida TaxID=392033 RepID=A0A814Y3I8_9BILA|nr:unnamed protein product [Rotaria sordida]
MDVQVDDLSFRSIQMNGGLSNVVIKEVVKLQLNSSSSSHKNCCICRNDLKKNAANISSEDRDLIFFTRNIWIPEGARCCADHLADHQLKQEAIDQIKPMAIRQAELNSADVQLLLNKSQIILENHNKKFNFDDPRSLTEDEYRLLTSLSKDDFNEFVKDVSSSGIRNSSNRSIRTAIGIYLCKIRLGLSNRFLACMFQLPDKKTVSRIIDNARQAILNSFVPYNLGFGHITRQDVINHHTTTIARELMCGGASNTAIIIIDGTYIHIQRDILVVDRGFRDSISVMQALGLDVAMPPFLDGKGQFSSEEANQSRCITKRDILVVDRGFRDSISVMQALGLDVAMPPFLDGKRQFSSDEANQSRCITKILMTKYVRYLDILLHAHRNKYEHPKEKLILLVHWTFLSRDFNIVKNNEYNKIMDEMKSENNSTNVDNNPHALLIPKDENSQLHLQMPLNNYVNENDGSLKNVTEFIMTVGNQIYDLTERKEQMDKYKEKELQQKQTLINK